MIKWREGSKDADLVRSRQHPLNQYHGCCGLDGNAVMCLPFLLQVNGDTDAHRRTINYIPFG